jgi:hypothetical protein
MPLPRPFVVAGESPITFGRSREENRRPFELQSSQYTVDWSAMLPAGETSCHVRVSFQRATADRNLTTLIDMTLDRQQVPRAWAASRISGVEPGRHELAILDDTGCEWSLTLTPGWGRPASH